MYLQTHHQIFCVFADFFRLLFHLLVEKSDPLINKFFSPKPTGMGTPINERQRITFRRV